MRHSAGDMIQWVFYVGGGAAGVKRCCDEIMCAVGFFGGVFGAVFGVWKFATNSRRTSCTLRKAMCQNRGCARRPRGSDRPRKDAVDQMMLRID